MGKKGKRGKRGKAVDSDDETEGQIPAQVQVDESDNESDEADGKILSDDPGPFFSEGLELIQERRAESHMKGLNILLDMIILKRMKRNLEQSSFGI